MNDKGKGWLESEERAALLRDRDEALAALAQAERAMGVEPHRQGELEALPPMEPYVDKEAEKVERVLLPPVRETVLVYRVMVGEYRDDPQTKTRHAYQLGSMTMYLEDAERLRNIMAGFWLHQLRFQWPNVNREDVWFAVEFLDAMMRSDVENG